MKKVLSVVLALFIALQFTVAQQKPIQKDYGVFAKDAKNSLGKISAYKDRKHYLMNANKVTTEVYNYGGIAPGYGLLRGVNNGVWRGVSYIFQFCPLIAAKVKDASDTTKSLYIVSDALWDYPAMRETNPTGDTLWCFEPITGYDDPTQPLMASNPAEDKNKDGKPDSWPRSWYNSTLGRYVWPGYLAQDVTNADMEVFWAMDDRANSEFNYFPFPQDPSRRGLGIQIDGRALQWSNTLAENTIFFIYTVTNISPKNLDTVFFGIYGDPDLGGGSPENKDDNGYFVPPYNYDGNHNVSLIDPSARSLVYFWDPDMKGELGLRSGYVGCKFLESPGNPNDGIDNDGDGLIDERQDDGIDNDKDWVAATDDVGIDGIPGTNDEGEGDGVPTAGKKLANGTLDPLHPGEPHYELTDLDESDQIGLTSFNSWTWNVDKVGNDESMYNRLKPQNFSDITQNTDMVFVFGSGAIGLKAGETKRISTALIFGESLSDLLTSAETVQRIYNANYSFYKPPIKPKVTAVPDDRKVTLYWDSQAETSVDPVLGKDFEGYVIYRSTDPSFGDVQTITDGKGSAFFSTPLKDINGNDCRWDVSKRDEPYKDINHNGKFDDGEPYTDVNLNGKWDTQITDWWKGYSPMQYLGRGVHYYLGDNTGLVHSFVDSNNVVNGQTYYYAVVAYDHGDSTGTPPTETTKKITQDPITMQYMYDDNTVMVVPGPRTSGYTAPGVSLFNLTHTNGISNASVALKVIDDLKIPNGINYVLSFKDSLNGKAVKNYSLLKDYVMTDQVEFFDTNYTKLSSGCIDKSFKVSVTDQSGTAYTINTDYIVDYDKGLVRRTTSSKISTTGKYTVSYKYFPIYQSTLFNSEDANPVTDGIMIKIKDQPDLMIDTTKTKWISGKTNCKFVVQTPSSPLKKMKYPADYELRFSSQFIDSARISIGSKFAYVPVKYSIKDITQQVPLRVPTFLREVTKDSAWAPGEEIIMFKPGSAATPTDTVTWGVMITAPADSGVAAVLPNDGDVMYISTMRPFTNQDVYSFKTEAGKVSNDLAKSKLDNIYVVPNPYVVTNSIEPSNRLPGKSRGERRIYFENLPQECKIRIYTLSGELVKVLTHSTTVQSGRENWDLLNDDGFSVAYGIYFAHIDAPGIGEKIIKFAIIK